MRALRPERKCILVFTTLSICPRKTSLSFEKETIKTVTTSGLLTEGTEFLAIKSQSFLGSSGVEMNTK